MAKNYYIYAYKHYWPPHLDPQSSHYDPNSADIPMPYTKDERKFVIEANSEKEAIKIAEKEYGSAERVDPKTHEYINNEDGSWTLMGVTKIKVMQ